MKNQIEKLLENFVPEGQQEKTDYKVFQDFAADEKNLKSVFYCTFYSKCICFE